MAEVALMSTVLLLILLGLIDFGRVFYFDVALWDAAREGARVGAQFQQGTSTNPMLDDADIKTAVDRVLTANSLPASSSRSGCPAQPASPAPLYNPPYTSSAYPQPNGAGTNQPWLYIVYDTSVTTACGAGGTGTHTTGTFAGKDMLVALVMNFGLIEGWLPSQIGGSNPFPIVAYVHQRVQGG